MHKEDKFTVALHNYKNVIDSLTNPVIIIDLEKRIKFMNRSALELFSVNENEVMNQSCCILNTPYCNTENCCIQRFLRKETGVIQYGPGEVANRVDVSYLRAEDGTPVGYINLSTDVRELIAAQKQLKISQKLYENALLQTRAAILEYDLQEDTLKRLDEQEDIYPMLLKREEVLENVPDSLIDRHYILPDSVEEAYRICKMLKQGIPELCSELHMQLSPGYDSWLSLTFTNVFNRNQKPVKAICISKDITEQKKLETQYENEREYREVLSLGYLSVFEVNLTQGRIMHINDEWRDSLHLSNTNISYDDLLHAMLELAKPQHRSIVSNYMTYDTLKEKYDRNLRQISFDYEKKIDNSYHWVNMTIHLIKKDNSQDLYACVYLKNIDKEKKKEEALKTEIEIDQLTNTMNRRGFIKHADHRLEIHSNYLSALMVLDIDNFKQVNDSFGHLYGDAVLSETAKHITKVCRDDTLIGRLGGDEFVILFSHLKDKQDIDVISKRLCNALETEYTSGSHTVKTSISIGIAMYPEHGTNFLELYEKADIALYHCKSNGRNQWALYHDDMKRYMQIMDTLNKNDEEESGLNKPFDGNIGEYVFRILYRKESRNPFLTISSVLELVARHFDMQLSYILNYDHKKGQIDILHQWEAIQNGRLTAIIKQLDHTQLFTYLNELKKQEDSIEFVENLKNHKDSPLRNLVERLDVLSYAQMCSSLSNDHDILIGLSSTKTHTFTRQKRNDLKTVFEVITTFLRYQHQQQLQEQHIHTLMMILDKLNYAVYVIDPKTYKIIYFNETLHQIFPRVQENQICYQCFRKRDTPCEGCPISMMNSTNNLKTNKLVYNKLRKCWLKTSAISINWIHGEHYIMISCVDITENPNNLK